MGILQTPSLNLVVKIGRGKKQPLPFLVDLMEE